MSLLNSVSRRILRSGANGQRFVISYNLKLEKGPYGGGNQVVKQIVERLEPLGYKFIDYLSERSDCILMLDPRSAGPFTFGYEDIRVFLDNVKRVPCIHRINECDMRKGTDFMDKELERASEVADFTVFVSRWLRDYHADRWFDRARRHIVVYNGADPRAYNTRGKRMFPGNRALRIITHHWSDNWMKGFHEYEQLDHLIHDGTIPDTELWVMGRWPHDVDWRSARLIGVTNGATQAEILKECDVYITASRWEPGANHFMEGIQCGLPVIYHEEGGGICEVASQCGVMFHDDLPDAVNCIRSNFEQYFEKTIANLYDGDQMTAIYRHLFDAVITGFENAQ